MWAYARCNTELSVGLTDTELSVAELSEGLMLGVTLHSQWVCVCGWVYVVERLHDTISVCA